MHKLSNNGWHAIGESRPFGRETFLSFTGVPTDRGRGNRSGINKNVTHTFSSFTWGPNWPFRCLDIQYLILEKNIKQCDFVFQSQPGSTSCHIVSLRAPHQFWLILWEFPDSRCWRIFGKVISQWVLLLNSASFRNRGNNFLGCNYRDASST